MSKAPRCPSVVRLFRRCRPSAVPWTVRAVIVDAVNRVAGSGARPHVPIEHGEVVPFGTHHDAAPAIPVITPVVSVATTLPHDDPNVVLGGAPVRSAAGKPVLQGSRLWPSTILVSPATARTSVTRSKVATVDALDCAAITLADPPDLAVWVRLRVFPQHGQAPESLAGRVLGNIVSHRVAPRCWPPVVDATRGHFAGEFYHA